MSDQNSKWKHFERLVTAIHQMADAGAQVQWNETINGRQFDVTIRFRKGLYNYLTVVECKQFATPVPVEKVEAFVTKAADAHAHHAVMASTSGFQSGAKEVAARHNMTLVHVVETSNVDISLFGATWGELTDVLHIESIELLYVDGEKNTLATESNVLSYYVEKIVVVMGGHRRSLNELIQQHFAQVPIGAGGYQEHVIPCASGARVVAPDDGQIPLKDLAAIHVRMGLTQARTITGPVGFEPYLLMSDVSVRNVASGEEKTFSQHDLALGAGNVFQVGRFYESPQLASFYYCARVEGELADVYLVESFQLGQLIQAELRMKTEFADRYIPVTDRSALERLQRRLAELERKQARRNRR